jgi:MFS transporter, PPP family, 3-phenylpropionic acid transporter
VPFRFPSGQAAPFALFFFAYYAYVGIFSPYASLLFADRGMSVGQIGILMSLTPVLRIFGPALWGWIADRSEQRVLVLRITALASVLAFVGMPFCSTFIQFLIVVVAVNAFASAQAPLSEALVLNALQADLNRYGKLRLWGSVGFIVAVMFAGAVLDQFGIAAMPWMALAMLALSLLASCCMREPPLLAPAREKGAARALLRRREVIAFFTSSFLMIAAHSSLYVFYSLYLANIGYSKSFIGVMWSLGVIAEIVFFFYQAPLFRRFGVRRLMLASLLIAALRFLMTGWWADSLLVLILAQLMHAATFGMHHSASMATMQKWFSGPLQARGQALYISISYGLGGAFGGLLLSGAWDKFGPAAVYYIAALMAAAGVVAALLCYRWQSRVEQKDENKA